MHTTIRTVVGDFTIEETIEDVDILMLSKWLPRME
jgi:hypothetical protein